MTKKINDETSRMKQILEIFGKEYPFASIQLHFGTPFELLVATILSAQCTDERVNIVTSIIFKEYNRPEDFAEMEPEKLEKLIYSTGYYKAKAKHIIESSKKLLSDFGGEVPSTMDELLTLPGVGRKTANVILGHCFDVPGIVVDTHVLRLANRLGFVNTKNTEKVEFQLMELIPKKDWVVFTHYLINHGRKICVSRKPRCSKCSISSLCPSKEI